MWSHTHDVARRAARETVVPPPSPEQQRMARHFREGGLGGVSGPVTDPFTEAEDDFKAAHPFGPGFDSRGRQLPSTASPDHSRADLRRYERSRASGFTDATSREARAFVAEVFDSNGHVRPGVPMLYEAPDHAI